MLTSDNQEKLNEEIQSIRSLLAEDVDGIAPETLNALNKMLHEMEQLLAEESVGDLAQLQENWQDAVLDFEVNHPEITNAVTAITSVLANAGI